MLLRNGKSTTSMSDYFEGRPLDYNKTYNSDSDLSYKSRERISYSEFMYKWNFYICITLITLYFAVVFSSDICILYPKLLPICSTIYYHIQSTVHYVYPKLHIYYLHLYSLVNDNYDKVIFGIISSDEFM